MSRFEELDSAARGHVPMPVSIATPHVLRQMSYFRDPNLVHDWSAGVRNFEQYVVALRALEFSGRWFLNERQRAGAVTRRVMRYVDYAPDPSISLSMGDAAYLGRVVHNFASVDPTNVRVGHEFHSFLGYLPIARLYDGWDPDLGVSLADLSSLPAETFSCDGEPAEQSA